MKEITRIEPKPLMKILGSLYALFGLLAGIFVIGISIYQSNLYGVPFSFKNTILGIILFPLLYGIVAALGALVIAFIYNLMAKKCGGIVIHLKTSTNGDHCDCEHGHHHHHGAHTHTHE